MFDFLPESISTFGADVDGIMKFIWGTVLVWLILAEIALVYFVVRYRRRSGVRAAWMPADTRRTNGYLLGLAVLVLICDLVIEVKSARVWDKVTRNIPAHDVLVRVMGRQYAWTFTYAGADGVLDTDDDFTTFSELHVPRDRVIRYQLESVDVVHSLWVPVLRLKQDAVPGRSFPGWFEATTDGTWEIACAEICGASHTAMRAELTVEPPEVFEAWAANHADQQARLTEKLQP